MTRFCGLTLSLLLSCGMAGAQACPAVTGTSTSVTSAAEATDLTAAKKKKKAAARRAAPRPTSGGSGPAGGGGAGGTPVRNNMDRPSSY